MQRIVGMRIVKSTLSLTICLVISQLINYDIPIYACIASILAMKVTPEESVQAGKDRILATIMGCLVAGLALWLIATLGVERESLLYRMMIVLTIFINLVLCKLVHLKEYVCSFSCVVILIVLTSHTGSDVMVYIAVRIIETICGIIVAVLVNKYVNIPLKNEDKPDDEAV